MLTTIDFITFCDIKDIRYNIRKHTKKKGDLYTIRMCKGDIYVEINDYKDESAAFHNAIAEWMNHEHK